MDINQLMKQAQEMEKQLEQANKQISSMEFVGSASNGLVKVTVNGDNNVLAIDIQEDIINKEDKEMLQDLIMIATNNAISKASQSKKEKFGSMASSLGLPKF